MSYSLLVVDDEALTLRTISRALREEGYEVFLASSGEEALELYAQEIGRASCRERVYGPV